MKEGLFPNQVAWFSILLDGLGLQKKGKTVYVVIMAQKTTVIVTL